MIENRETGRLPWVMFLVSVGVALLGLALSYRAMMAAEEWEARYYQAINQVNRLQDHVQELIIQGR